MAGLDLVCWGEMKIHAYRIVPRGNITLDAVLEHLSALSLQQRLRTVSDVQMRLEEGVKQNNGWLLDFGMIRHDGPGRASATTPIADFDLQDDEGFGQETAAYFDPGTGFMTLQYNHYGPRQGRIQSYLYRFACALAGETEADELPEARNGFTLVPVLKAEAANRLDRMGIVKNVEISFFVPGIVAQQGNTRQSLGSLLNMPLLGGAENVRIQVSASRGRAGSLIVNHVRQAVTDLLGLRENVAQLSVVAKETEDSPNEAVDFLEARLRADIPVPLGAGRRYGRDARLQALRQAFETWRANGQLR